MPPTSLPLVPEARTALLKVPLTVDEKSRLRALAASQGRSVSELVRLALPLTDSPSSPEGVASNPFRTQEPASLALTRAAVTS